MKTVHKETLKSWLGVPDLFLMDVRTDTAWKRSIAKIEQAHRFEPDKLAKMATDIPKNRKLVLYCEDGETAAPQSSRNWRRWASPTYTSWKGVFGPGKGKNILWCPRN